MEFRCGGFMVRFPIVRALLIAASVWTLGGVPTASEAASPRATAKAWELLLDNKPLEARAEFERVSKGSDVVAAGEAHRGLAQVARFLGQEPEQARQAYKAFARDRDTVLLLATKALRLKFARDWSGYAMRDAAEIHKALDRKPDFWTAPLSAELALRLANDGEWGRAREIDIRSAVIRDWWAIGPFSNVSGSGFDKVYPPETGVDLARSYEGKNGNKVSWFPIQVASPSNWVFIQHHFPHANAILYFAARVNSSEERKVFIGFGASGSFKVFLNGRLVLADRVFRNTGEDNFTQEVTLRKGANLLLVKLGNEERYSNFQARFLEADGRGVSGLVVGKPEGDFPSDPGVEPDLVRAPRNALIESRLQARLAADPDDADASTLLMDLYSFAENHDSAEALGLRQLERRPNSALWNAAMSEVMERSRQSTRAQEYTKAAFRASPLLQKGWAYEANRLAQNASSEAVLEYLKNSPEVFTSTPLGQTMKMIQLARLQREADLLAVFAEFEKQNEEYDYNAANLRAYLYKAQGKRAASEGAWKRLIEHEATSAGAYIALADLQYGAGDFSGASKTLTQGRIAVPDNPNLPLKLAGMHMQYKQYPQALEVLKAAEALAPVHSSVLVTKANLLTLMGRTEEARAALQRGVEYTYNDFASWDKLRELDGQPSFETLAPLPSVDSLLRAAADWEGLKREKGALIAYIEDLFFYPNRATRHRFFMVMHLPTQEAVNNATQYYMPYNGTYQTLNVTRALTRKRSGAEVDAEVRDYSVVFKSLEPGDAIVLEWSLKDDYDGDMARQAWGRFAFRREVSTFDARLRLYTAGADTVGYTVRGRGIQRETQMVGGVTVRTFRRAPLALPPEEKFLPETDSTAPDVLYSTFGDWGKIADWYADLTENKSDPAPILRRLADSLFRDAKTDAEKVARVQRYVSNSIAYSSLSFRQSGWVPQSAQEVLASRLGDCKDKAALAKSLLEIAGIRSHLVLVATRNEFGVRPGPVGPHFNHCILAYILNGKERFMELTDTELQWSHLSKFDQGAIALVARKGNTALIRLPLDSATQRVTRRTQRFVLSDNGDATIATDVWRTGIAANSMRTYYRHLSEEERKVSMRKSLSDDYSDVTLDSVWFSDLDPVRDSITYLYRFRAHQAVKSQGKARIFSAQLPDKLSASDIPGRGASDEGLDLYSAWYSVGTYDQTGTIEYPAGWKPLEIPQPVRLKTPYGEYSLVFQTRPGGGLSYTRKALFRLSETISTAEAEAVRAFLAEVVRSDDVQLIFTRM
jgi:tetratricopeptide (TPR) repeat protein